MPEVIQEFVDSRGQSLRHDPHASVLRGVKLLGLASRNNRVYRESALRAAIALYEGARVNVNHPQGDPLGPRDYRDRLGVVRNVELRPGDGLFGALHFNPKHPLAEQLAWDAEHAPENVGLSHNVLANTRRQGDQVVVESIVHVQSVDLVADPATTSGLFEHAEAAENNDHPQPLALGELTLEAIELHRPDLLAPLAEQHQAQLVELQDRAAQLEQQIEHGSRRERLLDLLAEHGLTAPGAQGSGATVGEQLFAALLELRDADAQRRAVQEHTALLRERQTHAWAVSQEQSLTAPVAEPSPADYPAFLTAVRGHR